jgi:hypothetical protein
MSHWLKADPGERDVARLAQRAAELEERVGVAETARIRAEARADDLGARLEREIENMALVARRLADARRDADVQAANFAATTAETARRNAGPNPAGVARANLQAGGPAPANGTLPRNNVRDSGNVITQAARDNRERFAGAQPSPRTASAPRQTAPATTTPLVNGRRQGTVRAGEGVSQVVQRELGTRDPEVIAWVIRENGIRSNARGNPIIHPNQKLTLPGPNDVRGVSDSAMAPPPRRR